MKTSNLILLTTFLSSVSGMNAADKVDEMTSMYANAKTEFEKRAVCIAAIDTGVLRPGVSIDIVKKVFGRDYENWGVDIRSNRLGRVHFVQPQRSTNALVSDVLRGWYLSLSYSPDGKILDYHLSNASKSAAMAPGRTEHDNSQKEDPGLPLPGAEIKKEKRQR